MVAANKMDLPEAAGNLSSLQQKFPELEIYPISAVTGSGYRHCSMPSPGNWKRKW